MNNHESGQTYNIELIKGDEKPAIVRAHYNNTTPHHIELHVNNEHMADTIRTNIEDYFRTSRCPVTCESRTNESGTTIAFDVGDAITPEILRNSIDHVLDFMQTHSVHDFAASLARTASRQNLVHPPPTDLQEYFPSTQIDVHCEQSLCNEGDVAVTITFSHPEEDHHKQTEASHKQVAAFDRNTADIIIEHVKRKPEYFGKLTTNYKTSNTDGVPFGQLSIDACLNQKQAKELLEDISAQLEEIAEKTLNDYALEHGYELPSSPQQPTWAEIINARQPNTPSADELVDMLREARMEIDDLNFSSLADETLTKVAERLAQRLNTKRRIID